jgi:hypothetical protein
METGFRDSLIQTLERQASSINWIPSYLDIVDVNDALQKVNFLWIKQVWQRYYDF